MYVGINTERGNVVSESEAFDYALEKVKESEEIRSEFEEWFFSGDWIKTEEDEELV